MASRLLFLFHNYPLLPCLVCHPDYWLRCFAKPPMLKVFYFYISMLTTQSDSSFRLNIYYYVFLESPTGLLHTNLCSLLSESNHKKIIPSSLAKAYLDSIASPWRILIKQWLLEWSCMGDPLEADQHINTMSNRPFPVHQVRVSIQVP